MQQRRENEWQNIFEDTERQLLLRPPTTVSGCIVSMFKSSRIRLIVYVLMIFTLLLTFFATSHISLVRDRYERRKFWWDQLILVKQSLSQDNNLNNNNSSSFMNSNCKNSRQGKEWLVDDSGHLCKQGQQNLESGCCPKSDITNVSRFSCEGCLSNTGCCVQYEFCVSCCLGPDALSTLELSLSRAGITFENKKNQQQKIDVFEKNKKKTREKNLYEEENPLKNTYQRFPLCSALCRTSSGSVLRQRFYKSNTHKHCWKPE